jgi:hypothetical protein
MCVLCYTVKSTAGFFGSTLLVHVKLRQLCHRAAQLQLLVFMCPAGTSSHAMLFGYGAWHWQDLHSSSHQGSLNVHCCHIHHAMMMHRCGKVCALAQVHA